MIVRLIPRRDSYQPAWCRALNICGLNHPVEQCRRVTRQFQWQNRRPPTHLPVGQARIAQPGADRAYVEPCHPPAARQGVAKGIALGFGPDRSEQDHNRVGGFELARYFAASLLGFAGLLSLAHVAFQPSHSAVRESPQ